MMKFNHLLINDDSLFGTSFLNPQIFLVFLTFLMYKYASMYLKQ